MDLGGDQHGLARMAGIALFDRDDVEQAATAGFVTPHTPHIRNAGFFDLFPNQRRFHHAFSNGVV